MVKPLIVLAGPTASGKTALSLLLAETFGGEIVSCDSVAVYRMLDVGSAKPSAAERARVPHHGLDLYDPNEHPTAGDYARHARATLDDITRRGKLPIIAGGTGLYLRATLEGLAPAPLRNEPLRDKLRARAEKHGSAYIHRVLQRLDARAAAAIHANDTPKIIRSIEVTLAGRAPQTEQWLSGRDALQGFRVLKLGLNPPRPLLYERINVRAAQMFDRGLLQETDAIRAQYGADARALTTLGYLQALAVLQGSLDLPEAIAQVQQGHRNYAKRQMTWFRRDGEMHFLNGPGDDDAVQQAALDTVRSFLAADEN
ncbi:tRNA (adenosine(37)-N6)-dimethylallyltransferase MiaA [Granulicella cerasi]|uniref:tRNA dimethylallyltransferase n=1 Tax=Granulicella cerasi TaxID=741063 RepID=A0ABW1ZC27_9BACT|nr:tRNA (adenosine(37)-N6)-dimethylallyltransferase MiaA [Granulicella cerasi]